MILHALHMDLCEKPASEEAGELSFTAKGTNSLVVATPSDEHVAPPGYYMLFLSDDSGVPSEPEFLRLYL